MKLFEIISKTVTCEFREAEKEAFMRGAEFSQIYMVLPNGEVVWSNFNW